SYQASQWNYHWRSSYGSDRYSPLTDKLGTEPLKIESVTLGPDGRSVKLNIRQMIPVDQAHITIRLKAANGTAFTEELYWTINHIPTQ
ncbi:MAG: hypothetical protein CMM01_22270, partial [Rhodopirellula sp.]|nr:hypothetical protein [Rhodopirellula sp.]